MKTPAQLEPRDRLIVALDLPSIREAEAVIETLGDTVGFYKIGYQLAFERGIPLAAALAAAGQRVFLDMKLHDIGNTVARGVENVVRMGVTFLTVHAYPQTMRAAVAASAGSKLKLLAVTVLTSYDDTDLAEAGYSVDVEHLVAERAAQARDIGVDGIVCSAEEAAPLRLIAGTGMTLVTPGIRPAAAARDDQKRVATPASAIAAGVDYLVVGRPIVAAADPKAAAKAIVEEIAQACKGR
jgi:orotidine-5'-phosphate decarboxylase